MAGGSGSCARGHKGGLGVLPRKIVKIGTMLVCFWSHSFIANILRFLLLLYFSSNRYRVSIICGTEITTLVLKIKQSKTDDLGRNSVEKGALHYNLFELTTAFYGFISENCLHNLEK